jgi:anti-repressor protein
VTAEVLPSIRKNGGYMVAAPQETPEELALRALTVLQATVERQKAQLADAMPKAAALDRIALADGALGLMESAKAFNSRVKDFTAYLHKHGWIYKRPGGRHWLGYHAHTANGDLTHKVTVVPQPDGSERVFEQVKVTPQGLTKLAAMLPSIH